MKAYLLFRSIIILYNKYLNNNIYYVIENQESPNIVKEKIVIKDMDCSKTGIYNIYSIYLTNTKFNLFLSLKLFKILYFILFILKVEFYQFLYTKIFIVLKYLIRYM